MNIEWMEYIGPAITGLASGIAAFFGLKYKVKQQKTDTEIHEFQGVTEMVREYLGTIEELAKKVQELGAVEIELKLQIKSLQQEVYYKSQELQKQEERIKELEKK